MLSGCPFLRDLYIVQMYGELPELEFKPIQNRAEHLAVHAHCPFFLNYDVADMPV